MVIKTSDIIRKILLKIFRECQPVIAKELERVEFVKNIRDLKELQKIF